MNDIHPAFENLKKSGLIEKGRYWERGITVVEGCTPCSPGCKNCWAAEIHHRFRHTLTDERGQWTGEVSLHLDRLERAAKRQKPTVFSIWNDLFHEDVPAHFTFWAFNKMAYTGGHHIFLVLTKRPERIQSAMYRSSSPPYTSFKEGYWPWNVWLGVTVCNQAEAERNIPLLLEIPAAVRFINLEPLLEAIDFQHLPYLFNDGAEIAYHVDALTGRCARFESELGKYKEWRVPGLDWVIAGGETGVRARPAHPDWFRSVRDQCQDADVPFFFKQWGEWHPGGGKMRVRGKPCRDVPLTPARNEHHRMFRVGRNTAGRVLDRRTWEEVPVI